MQNRKLKVRRVGEYFHDVLVGKPVKLQIKIEGRWLHDAGFEDGDYVTVTQTPNGIEIRKEQGNDTRN